MKKFAKTFVVAIVCYSLSIATPLMGQNESNTGTYQTADRNDDGDRGNWGLVGLLGLLGLLGFRKRDDVNRTKVSRNP